jgi:hypothetical protein
MRLAAGPHGPIGQAYAVVTVLFGPSGAADEKAGVFVPPQRRQIGFLFQDYALCHFLRWTAQAGRRCAVSYGTC